MLKALEAVIDEEGNVQLLESIHLPAAHRALVIILEEEVEEDSSVAVSETALLSEQALAADWSRPEEDETWPHPQQAAQA
ncbi:MAG: hypothetical protein HY326_08455 [Chloroflexi bacterium]|nr:hypothetical protein [Chloroflexota bacterium]